MISCKTCSSSTLAQDFASWLQANDLTSAKQIGTPDIDKYIASQYIRSVYPNLSFDDATKLMNSSPLTEKLGRGSHRHVQSRISATWTSLRLKGLLGDAMQKIQLIRTRIEKRYPHMVPHFSIRHRRKEVFYNNTWLTDDNCGSGTCHVQNSAVSPNQPSTSKSVSSPVPLFSDLDLQDPFCSPVAATSSAVLRESCLPRRKSSPVDSLILLNQRINQEQVQCSVSETSGGLGSPLTSPVPDGMTFDRFTGSQRENQRPSRVPEDLFSALFKEPEAYCPPCLFVN